MQEKEGREMCLHQYLLRTPTDVGRFVVMLRQTKGECNVRTVNGQTRPVNSAVSLRNEALAKGDFHLHSLLYIV